MKGVPASLSRRGVSKEKSGKDACIERIKLTELALQRWKDFAAAYKTYNDLQSTMAKAITEFVRTHSSDDPAERQEAACNGDQQKQEHKVEEDPNKAKKKKTKGADNAAAAGNSTHASSIEAKVEDPSSVFESLLADLEGQSEKNVEDNGSLCKLLEIDMVQTQTTTKASSSNKLLARSLSRSFSFKFLSSAWRSRSSKVRCSPSDAEDGHSSTLKYLCAWEKQLHYLVERVLDEEKTGGFHEVNVAKQSTVLSFKQIQYLKDQKLRPHLDQLLRSLTLNWKKNSDCYSAQVQIMSQTIVKYTRPRRLCSDVPHWRAAKKLKAQLEEWLACFANYVSSHKAYIKALHDWARHPLPAFCEDNNDNSNNIYALPLLGKWSSCLDKLFADVTVTKAIGDLATKVGELVELQNKEYEHKSQVDQLKGEQRKIEQSRKAKDKSDKLTQRIKEEEVQYEASRKETEENALNLIQKGFTSLFGSLDEFSKSFAQKYDDIRK
ncbi:hypothetical protein ACLB2K_033438 [Fragaria x ananassa]